MPQPNHRTLARL